MSLVNTASDVFDSLGLTREPPKQDERGMQMEDFMNLLVTELTNQDPFKPMENSEMATQISQFATVSGIDELNTSFSSLAGSLSSSQALQAAELVGREVLIPSNYGYLSSGGSISGSAVLPESASNITLRVTDSSGALVREMSLGMQAAGEFTFNWDGADDAGDYLPSGTYHMSLQADIGGESVTPEVMVNAEVQSVSLGAPGQPLSLNLNGLGTISFNDVVQIH